MIDFLDENGPGLLVLTLISILMICIGVAAATPTELENGCIVYGNKIYCEIDNKVEDKNEL